MSRPLFSLSFGRGGRYSMNNERLVRALSRLQDIENNRDIAEGMRQAGDTLATNFRRGILQGYKYTKSKNPTRPKSLYSSVTNRSVRKHMATKRYVGFQRGGGYHGNVAHLVDRGTKERFTKAGVYTGRMPANHFASIAFQRSVGRMEAQVTKGIEKAIIKS